MAKSKRKQQSGTIENVEQPIQAASENQQYILKKINLRFPLAHPDLGNVLSKESKENQQALFSDIEKYGTRMLEWMSPTDPCETLLMQQMLLSQEWMTYCLANASSYIRSGNPQIEELGLKLMNNGRKFMGMYAKQMELLDKRRQQNVSSVNVKDGGQAIVGNVTVNNGK
jgi:hypothetical protein